MLVPFLSEQPRPNPSGGGVGGCLLKPGHPECSVPHRNHLRFQRLQDQVSPGTRAVPPPHPNVGPARWRSDPARPPCSQYRRRLLLRELGEKPGGHRARPCPCGPVHTGAQALAPAHTERGPSALVLFGRPRPGGPLSGRH